MDSNKKVSVMRILLANLTKMVGDTGGLAKVTAAFANEMQRRGHEGISTILLMRVSTHMICVIMRVKVILSLFGTRQSGRFCAPLTSVKPVV